MKILNLFAGIGGIRTLWNNKHKIVAVENNQQIAMIYLKRFPNDKIIIGDAYEYLEKHYKEFDFICVCPPCTTHTKFRISLEKKLIPDMRLYGIIIFLERWFKGDWIVENVRPYYNHLIKYTAIIGRHCFWSNILLESKKQQTAEIRTEGSLKWACEMKGLDFEEFKQYNFTDKRKHIRNTVNPKIGKYILDCVLDKHKLKSKKIWDYF